MGASGEEIQGLTRRALLARTTAAAITASSAVAASGCAAVGTRAAALSAPQAVRPLIHHLANPAAAISSGDAWVAFCDSLKPLAKHVTGPSSLGNLQIQTEGIRLLGRLVGLGLDRFVEHANAEHPSFYELQTDTQKYLGDNPDQTYRGAAIDASGTYLIRGNARDAAAVEIGLYAGSFQSDKDSPNGGRRLVDSLDETHLSIEENGNFEILVRPANSAPIEINGSATPLNMLTTEPDANAILIRTYFWDRTRRQQHEMATIERLDVTGPRPPIDPTSLIRGFIATTLFVDGSLTWWNDFQEIQTKPNAIFEMKDDGTVQTPSQIRYLSCLVEIEPDQALVAEFDPKDEPGYWNWVLQNVWGESLDWRDRPIVLNNRDVERDTSGGVKIIVAHHDPGHPNWMDMSSHPRLLLSLRWRGEAPLPKVTTRVVPITSVYQEA